jgi:signal peptidase I
MFITAIGLYYWNPFHAPASTIVARIIGVDVLRQPSDAMVPSIEQGTVFFASLWPYFFRDPVRGDVVIFEYPPDPSVRYAKRVVAGPGSHASMNRCLAIVNGVSILEPYATVIGDETAPECSLTEMVVAEGEYFVLSDVRVGTSDSRQYGAIPRANIYARAIRETKASKISPEHGREP